MNRNQDILIVDAGARTLQAFMTQVYSWMFVGLLATATVAYFTFSTGLVIKFLASPVLFYGCIIAQFALVIGLSWGINRLSGEMATAGFLLYSVLMGITVSIIFIAYTKTSIVSTLFITAGTFGAMSLYGYVTKRDLTGIGSFCMMGLFGIIIASFVNYFLKNSTLYWFISYAGVLIFIGLTAHDTQKLKEMGEVLSEDDANTYRKYSILGALTLYLDFINLFLFLLRILGDRR